MSRNLARQISRDLLSDCFTMILTAGLYCDSRAHKVRKVRVVKYMVVCGQIKAADQKYCNNQKWRRKLKEISFRTTGFWDGLDDFWMRYCRAKVLDLSCVLEWSVFINRINSKFFKRGKEEYAFSVDKKTHDGKIRLCNWRFNCNLSQRNCH